MPAEHHHIITRQIQGTSKWAKKEHSPPRVDTDGKAHRSHTARYVCATVDLGANGTRLAPRKSVGLTWWKHVKATAEVHWRTTSRPMTPCSSPCPWAALSALWHTGHNYRLACLKLLALKGTCMFSLCLILVFLSSSSGYRNGIPQCKNWYEWG